MTQLLDGRLATLQFAAHIAALLHKQFSRIDQTFQIADFVGNTMTLCMCREPINIGLFNLYQSFKVPNLTKSANNVGFWRRKSPLKGIHVLFFSVGVIPTLGESRVLGSMQEAVHGPKCGLMPFHPP